MDLTIKPKVIKSVELWLDQENKDQKAPFYISCYYEFNDSEDYYAGYLYDGLVIDPEDPNIPLTVDLIRWYRHGTDLEYTYDPTTRQTDEIIPEAGFETDTGDNTDSYTLKVTISPKKDYTLKTGYGGNYQESYGYISGVPVKWEKENGKDVMVLTYYPYTIELNDRDNPNRIYKFAAESVSCSITNDLNYTPKYKEFYCWEWDQPYEILYLDQFFLSDTSFTMISEPLVIWAKYKLKPEVFALIKSVDNEGVTLEINHELKPESNYYCFRL